VTDQELRCVVHGYPEATLTTAALDVRLVMMERTEAKPLGKLVTATEAGRTRGRRRRRDGPAGGEQLLEDSRLDRLARAYVVGDEEVHAGEGKRLPERFEMVVLGDDPGAERRLKREASRPR